jgi:N-terminal acetyltransferase B complex non-catalytic subunit
LEKIVIDVCRLHKAITADQTFDDRIPKLDRDPRVELSLVAAMSLLKLSGLGQNSPVARGFSAQDLEIPTLLQTIVLLDSQLHQTPNDIPLRLVLVQLYLRLGCASLAHQLWIPMDVKRTIQDALSPLFFDRISSVSPALFQGGRPFMEPLRSYYSNAFQDQAPVKIWDAFSSGSYSSILDMAEYNDRLRRSCTRVMTVVEERRAARAFGGKMDDLEDIVLFCMLREE